MIKWLKKLWRKLMTWLVDADVTEPLIVSQVRASGGTESTINLNGKQYKLHTFTSSGELLVTAGGDVEVLVVGAGGSGGAGVLSTFVFCGGGGGGGGGVVNCKLEVFGGGGFLGEYDIVVGTSSLGSNGGDSAIITSGVDQVRAKGGGRGGNVTLIASGNAVDDGQDGGSSGGGAFVFDSGVYADQSSNAGNRVFGQGNNGANAIEGGAGGGGGAGQAANPAKSLSALGYEVLPIGGNGVASSITGSIKYYGGGGGGGNSVFVDTIPGGLGGGGAGATNTNDNSEGLPNTGGGGGGGGLAVAGKGGSGIVIIRYPIEG
jgi:hypothetical protein